MLEPAPAPASEQVPTDDFALLEDRAPRRQSAASVVLDDREATAAADEPFAGERLAGSLVHRFLQRTGVGAPVSDDELRALAAAVRPAGDAPLADRAAVIREAIARYRVLAQRADLLALYASGDALHEVPFVMRQDGAMVRGSIDCLVRGREGQVTVLEFKTGRRREAHARQADLYARAAQAVFPGSPVEARVIYAEGDGI